MKKFSFKKLATVSLFFTSIIFTSAFTTCFIPTISTSHSNDQPNATKIDLNDYNNKSLPKFEKPEPGEDIKKILIGQLKNIGPTPPVGWENWECYPNQFNLEIKSSTDTGGSFVLTAKPNAVNYVGNSTATISFNYTDSSKTDISTIITNIQLTTDTNAFSATPSSQQLLTQLKQVNQNARINSLTVDPSTAVWDKTHVIVGDETHSGSYKVTVSVKPNDLIYTGTVDVYYLIKRSQLNFTQTSLILPSIQTDESDLDQPWDTMETFLDANDIDASKIFFDIDCYSIDRVGVSTNPYTYDILVNANPYFLDLLQTVTITLAPDDPSTYFTLNYDQLNAMDGWSGFTSGAIRFYKFDLIHHRVGMIDETLATYKDTQHEISIHGTDAVLGNDVIDLGITWTVTEGFSFVDTRIFGSARIGTLGFANPSSSLANNETFTGSFTINSSLKSTGRCFLRWQFLITQIIFPNDSSIENLSSFSFYNLNITSLRIPNSVVRIGRTLLSNGGAKSVYPMTTLFIDVNYFISLNIYDVLPSAQWITRIEDCNLGNNSGKGRIYVKNETLRQQYIHDETWSTKLKPGPDSTLEEMILVDPTI